MATEYSLYVRHEVYSLLQTIKKQPRARILRFLDNLQHNPYQHGDYEAISPESRPIQVKIIGSFALLFGADHAVSEVKVVDLVPADS
jgi:hypothetical protein